MKHLYDQIIKFFNNHFDDDLWLISGGIALSIIIFITIIIQWII